MKSKIFLNVCLSAVLALGMTACQKMDKPEAQEYPVDANPPGGPLKFYAAFDGTTSNPLMNAVDSIRANFPADNPLNFVDGVKGKALAGTNKKFLKYGKPNDWAGSATSFTISFWYKGNAQTKNNTGGNGPEYIMSFKAPDNHHWSGATTLVFLEGSNTACAIKVMMVDKNKADNWFTWENANMIPSLLDNNWHHIALVYDASTSGMTLYKDGVANPNVPKWNNHGAINLDHDAITEFRVGGGPDNNIDSDDWLASTWKGNIDQLRLYSVALTTAQINSLFTNKQ